MLASSRRLRIAAFTCCVALGFLIEGAQSLVYPNAIEWRDVRDDTVGVFVFSAATLLVMALFSSRLKAHLANGLGY